MGDPVVVAMDGSTRVSTAALLVGRPGDWRVLACRAHTDGRSQARVLLRLVDDMLAETGRGPGDLAGVVTGTGPGTFTGVRISVATARGLALALDIPVWGVSTLAALTAGAAVSEAAVGRHPEWIVPVVDARRGQVFYGLYRRVGGSAAYARTEGFAVCDRGVLVAHIPAGAVIVGSEEILTDEAVTGPAPRDHLQAREVQAEYLLIGQDRLEEPDRDPARSGLHDWFVGAEGMSRGRKPGEPGTPEAVKPIYVRSPDADIHITKMRDPWAEVAPGG